MADVNVVVVVVVVSVFAVVAIFVRKDEFVDTFI